MMDPEFESAANAIEQYTAAECGIELGAGTGAGATGSDAPGTDGSEPGEIDVEDVDAVKDANDGATWVDKLSTDRDQRARATSRSAPSGDGPRPRPRRWPHAPRMLAGAVGASTPDVSVEVANGDTVVARSTGVGCARSLRPFDRARQPQRGSRHMVHTADCPAPSWTWCR